MDSYELNKMLEKMAEECDYDGKTERIDLTKIDDPDLKQKIVDSYMNRNLTPNRKAYRRPIFI